MSWWFVSSPHMTCAVEVEDGKVKWAPPILKRFIGQPSKSLGRWMRAQGNFEFHRLTGEEVGTGLPRQRGAGVASSPPQFPYVYSWGNNEVRAKLKGRKCRIVARGTMRTVLIEFENGERVTTSIRALRALKRRTDEM